jgi:peptide/nickel transport system substrate-binding protein
VTQAEQYKWLQGAQRKLAEDAVNGFLFELPKLGVAKKGLKGLWTNSPAFIHYIAEMRWE